MNQIARQIAAILMFLLAGTVMIAGGGFGGLYLFSTLDYGAFVMTMVGTAYIIVLALVTIALTHGAIMLVSRGG